MRKGDDGVVFVIDSDTSPDQSLPGRKYTASVPNLHRGFTRLTADQKILCDEWGCFLSGYAPLKNGQGNYLIGIDLRADEVNRKFRAIRIAGIILLICSIILAYLFSRFLASRITRPIRLLVKRTREIADGVFVGRVDINPTSWLMSPPVALSTSLKEKMPHLFKFLKGDIISLQFRGDIIILH